MTEIYRATVRPGAMVEEAGRCPSHGYFDRPTRYDRVGVGALPCPDCGQDCRTVPLLPSH